MRARYPAAAREPAAEDLGQLVGNGDVQQKALSMVIAGLRIYLGRMRPEDILVPSREGICCKPGGFHIDPTRSVAKALITHGHSDHARAGHGAVLATQETLDIMRLRYGENFAGSTQAVRYGETLVLDGARVTFHPAGHVLGSAQISVECKGFRVVASGDYKNVPDPTCTPFELVPCDVFITEATFGLPVFRHPDPAHEIAKLLRSVALFPDRAHLVGAYGFGKAQRVIALLRAAGYGEPVYLHGAIETITRYYAERGIDLGPLELVRGTDKAKLGGKIIICPPGSMGDLWSRRFPDPVGETVRADARRAARLSRQWLILIDGAIGVALVSGDADAALDARAAGRSLLESLAPKSGSDSQSLSRSRPPLRAPSRRAAQRKEQDHE